MTCRLAIDLERNAEYRLEGPCPSCQQPLVYHTSHRPSGADTRRLDHRPAPILPPLPTGNNPLNLRPALTGNEMVSTLNRECHSRTGLSPTPRELRLLKLIQGHWNQGKER